ncbi:PspC domain-containing protein [Nonomuraea sp. NPDC050556]|uniref:PspC domain-containing protein n=1 Tax=Nonomuraea sp. NPDC050556 TaxID=3364369 RepID=UPI0037AD6223
MTEAPPAEPAAPPRTLQRSSEGRILMGVCSGLGRYTGIDPVVFRAAFAILVLGSGIGIFLYIAAFLLMKEPTGRSGLVEQWTGRDFDADTVMALLTAVLGFGLMINLATVWLGTGTLVVGTLLAIALLAAHSNGVDLMGLARSMPERLNRRRTATAPPHVAPPMPDFSGFNPPTAPMAAERPTAAFAAEAPAAATRVNETLDAPREAAPGEAPPREEPFREEPPRQEPRPTSYAHGEPFAPRGPYQPLDPRKRAGYEPPPYDSPYDPALYGRPIPPQKRQERQKRPRSFIGGITFLLAAIIGGIVVAVQSTSGSGLSMTAVGGAMLITIGAGLLVATWWGRGAGLVALGTLVALVVGFGLMFGGVPRKIGSPVWNPTSVAEASKRYEVGLGDGKLDLTDLEMTPGTKVTFNAEISVGELLVIVPPDARVEVHARNKFGDIKIDHSVTGGADVTVNEVLTPDVPPKGDVSTIVLNIDGGIGDIEVRRGA